MTNTWHSPGTFFLTLYLYRLIPALFLIPQLGTLVPEAFFLNCVHSHHFGFVTFIRNEISCAIETKLHRLSLLRDWDVKLILWLVNESSICDQHSWSQLIQFVSDRSHENFLSPQWGRLNTPKTKNGGDIGFGFIWDSNCSLKSNFFWYGPMCFMCQCFPLYQSPDAVRLFFCLYLIIKYLRTKIEYAQMNVNYNRLINIELWFKTIFSVTLCVTTFCRLCILA